MAVKDRWKAMFIKPETTAPKPQSGAEIGYTGTRIFSGLPMEEYNHELAFPQSIAVYDRMRRSDGQIAAILAAVTLPILSTKWYVKPEDDADDEKLAEDIADFIEDMLFNGLKYPWADHLREALLMCVFGFSIFEKVYRTDTWNGKPVIVLDKFAPRVASSIWRFPQDENYDITAVDQINYMTGAIKTIPIDRCQIYTHQREGSNIVGISMLRPAYKHWYIKDALYTITSVGIEKTLIGTPYAKIPSQYSEEEKKKILAVISAIRGAEEAGFTIANDVVLDTLDASGAAGVQQLVTSFIEHQDTQIARSVLAQFINLGTMASASGGSYALGSTMVDMFVMGLENKADYIQGAVQKVIEEVVAWNFGPDAPMPKLCHERISSLFQDSAQIAQAIYWLGAGHALTPDEELENKVREMLGIPPMSQQAIDTKLKLPADRYNPDIIPDSQPTPEEDAAIAQRVKEASKGQAGSSTDGSADVGTAGVAANSANKAAMSEKNRILRGLFDFAEASGITSDEMIDTWRQANKEGKGDSMKFGDDSTNGETPAAPGKWHRDLTDREKAVQFDEIDQQWTTFEQQFVQETQPVLRTASDQYIAQISKILNSGQTMAEQIAAMSAVQFPLASTYTNTILDQMKQQYEFGQTTAAQELNAQQSVSTPPANTAALAAKAQAIAEAQLARLSMSLQMNAISLLQREIPPRQILSYLRTTADAYITGPDLKAAGMITVAENINMGRGSAAKQIGIQGAQVSAVLDEKTCPLCAELDSKVISVDNPDFDLFRPPLHNGCRCLWVYILAEEEGVEFNWTTPSHELVKRYGHLINA